MKPILRSLLRTWARVGKAPGLYCQVFQKWGPRLSSGSLETRLPNGSVMLCDLTEEVQRFLYFVGLYEPIESWFFCHLIKPGAIVIDAGANVGQYTLLASTQAGPQGQVHSFEPMPENFNTLRHHVELNHCHNVHLNQVALWSEPGEMELYRPLDGEHNNGSFVILHPDPEKRPTNIDSQSLTKVPVLTLDQYVEEHNLPSVDLIKMDIEGAEPFVLQGARRTLERFRPPILAEVRQDALAGLGTTLEEFETLLQDLQYRAFDICADRPEKGHIERLAESTSPNLILHRDPLPAHISQCPPLKSILHWARSGWARHGSGAAPMPAASPA